MLKDIFEVKEVRKKLGLTQAELAERANVSQSLIAKVENGSLMPSYEKGREILDVLEDMLSEEIDDGDIEDICNRDIISIDPDDSVETALNLMRENAISQLPVIDKGDLQGSISERCLLHNFDEVNRNQKVSTIMDESFPIIDKSSDINVVKDILRYYPSVIISDKGDLIGIITKADLLKNL